MGPTKAVLSDWGRDRMRCGAADPGGSLLEETEPRAGDFIVCAHAAGNLKLMNCSFLEFSIPDFWAGIDHR